jgi:hypothetical protein
MQAKALDLFQAYGQNKLPAEGGYIVSSFFQEQSSYSIYEVVAYSGVKALYLSQDGLTFQTDGNKLYVLAEPVSFTMKHEEPFRRENRFKVPQRFSEMETVTTRNQTKILVSKEPVLSYSSFTILRPRGINFAFIFYNLPDVLESIAVFFEKTLNQEAAVPQKDAQKASRLIVRGLQNFTIWKD